MAFSQPLWQELDDTLAAEDGPAAELLGRYRRLLKKNLRLRPWVAALTLLGPLAASALFLRMQSRSSSEWLFGVVVLGYLPGAFAAVQAQQSLLPKHLRSDNVFLPSLLWLAALHFAGFFVSAPLIAAAKTADLRSAEGALAIAAHVVLIYFSVYPLPSRSTRADIERAIEQTVGPATTQQRSLWGPPRLLARLASVGPDLAALIRFEPRRLVFAYGAAAAVISEIAAWQKEPGQSLAFAFAGGLLLTVAQSRDDGDLNLGIQARLGLARTHFRLGHLTAARFFASEVLDTRTADLPRQAQAAALLLLIKDRRRPFENFESSFKLLLDYAGEMGTTRELLSLQRTREVARL